MSYPYLLASLCFLSTFSLFGLPSGLWSHVVGLEAQGADELQAVSSLS